MWVEFILSVNWCVSQPLRFQHVCAYVLISRLCNLSSAGECVMSMSIEHFDPDNADILLS